MKPSAKATIYGCYLGYITQAIVNNLPPLLFLTFRREFGVTLDQISLLITMNFCVQILVDLISPKIIEKTASLGATRSAGRDSTSASSSPTATVA